MALLEMKNIHKWFGSVHALRGVDFHVNQSEIVGLVGGNGAGKSTLIKIIMGVYQADEGEIFFRGKKVNFSSPREARKSGIEAIYQEMALADDLSVARNLFMGRELEKKLVGPIRLLDLKNMKKESEKVLRRFGMNIQSMDQEIRFCSGGERQAIAVARAMRFKASLVILDEPTSALSPVGLKRVIRFIEELKRMGIASIYISHEFYHPYPIVDRFVVLSRGEKTFDVLKKDISIDELTKTIVE